MTRKRQDADEVRRLMEQQKHHEEVFGVRRDIVLDATAADADWRHSAFRTPDLTPEELEQLPQIQALFHGLIRSRCAEGRLPVPKRLPNLRTMKIRPKPRWFAVPGMYSGFSCRLVGRRELTLVVESWFRVVGGSGMRHAITTTQVIVEEHGFV